jgi:hypothetical protein
MKVLIEHYRGFEISFNSETEEFYFMSDTYDTEAKRKSFSAAKKWIDDFIKENNTFKPKEFVCADGRKITVVGFHKDGKVVIDRGGKKAILSSYEEKYFVLYDQKFDEIFNEINALDAQRDDLNRSINLLEGEITGIALNEYKKQFVI